MVCWSSSSGPTRTRSGDDGASTSWSGRRGAALGRTAGEGRLDECSGARGIDGVGLLAGCHVLEDAVGVGPQAVLLEGILELDAEAAREHRQVVLDRESALRLEAADHALAAVIDARQRIGT